MSLHLKSYLYQEELPVIWKRAYNALPKSDRVQMVFSALCH